MCQDENVDASKSTLRSAKCFLTAFHADGITREKETEMLKTFAATAL
jgi:hypothetical protein